MSVRQIDGLKAQRLHRASPLFILLKWVRESVLGLLFGGVYLFKYGHSSEYIIYAVIASAVVYPIASYWFYRYWIGEDEIEIKEGVFHKTHRKIPYTRIQNVSVSQGPLERLLKVSTLQLESASGQKPEAVMRVVGQKTVERIKAKVKMTAAPRPERTTTQQQPADENLDVLINTPLIDVLKLGIISQRGMVIAAALFGFISQQRAVVDYFYSHLSQFYDFPALEHASFTTWILILTTMAAVLFVSLQLLSIAWAVLKFYKFNLAIQSDKLQIEMGLLSKISSTIPLTKIQLFRVNANPIHKLFKARTVTIETAGGVNNEKSGIAMRWLAPYIDASRLDSLLLRIEPGLDLAQLKWQFIPQRSWKRMFKRKLLILVAYSAILLFVASLPQISLRAFTWIIVALMIPVAFIYARKYVRTTAFCIDNEVIGFKSGVWFSKQSFVKIDKIQSIQIKESPFDRRSKMATLEIDTAGSNLIKHHIKIPYLERVDAVQLKDQLHLLLHRKLEIIEGISRLSPSATRREPIHGAKYPRPCG